MQIAMAEARKAAALEEVPVGAIAVYNGDIIGRGYNRKESDTDPTAHAEMFALKEAAQKLENWRLLDVTLYCTLEPCPMCAGAILQARIPRIVYGALDPKAGAVDSLYNLLADQRLNHQVEVVSGVMANECGSILTEFFREQRRLGKK